MYYSKSTKSNNYKVAKKVQIITPKFSGDALYGWATTVNKK